MICKDWIVLIILHTIISTVLHLVSNKITNNEQDRIFKMAMSFVQNRMETS